MIISFLLWPQTPDLLLWLAAALMGFGDWRHVRERQEHEHTHSLWNVGTVTTTTSIISIRIHLPGPIRALTHMHTGTRRWRTNIPITRTFITSICILTRVEVVRPADAKRVSA